MPPPAAMKLKVAVSQHKTPMVSLGGGNLKALRKRRWTLTDDYDKDNNAGKRRKTLTVQSDTLTFRGDDSGPLSIPEACMQYYLAEVNKATGQVTMSPAHIFQLQPRTKEDLQKEKFLVDSLSQKKSLTPVDMLTASFGSQKQKSAMESRHKNKMTGGAFATLMGSAVDASALTQPRPQQGQVAEDQEAWSAIPPFNRDAQSPAEVYSLKDILGPTQMDALVHAADVFIKCSPQTLREWREKETYQRSVLCRLQSLPLEEGRRQQRSCQLLYLHYMLCMFHLRTNQIRKRDPLPTEWPDVIKHWMLDKFTVKMDSQKRCVPARVKNLLLSHILVLCLITDDYSTPLGDLLRDLRISLTRLQTHVRALGCRVKTSVNKDSSEKMSSAVLTVPLTFPEPRKGKKKDR